MIQQLTRPFRERPGFFMIKGQYAISAATFLFLVAIMAGVV
jgi:hypothetical protein